MTALIVVVVRHKRLWHGRLRRRWKLSGSLRGMVAAACNAIAVDDPLGVLRCEAIRPYAPELRARGATRFSSAITRGCFRSSCFTFAADAWHVLRKQSAIFALPLLSNTGSCGQQCSAALPAAIHWPFAGMVVAHRCNADEAAWLLRMRSVVLEPTIGSKLDTGALLNRKTTS
eukprot:1990723-Prymnesium_polylepis.1